MHNKHEMSLEDIVSGIFWYENAAGAWEMSRFDLCSLAWATEGNL